MLWLPLFLIAAVAALYTPWRWTFPLLCSTAIGFALVTGAMSPIGVLPLIILAALVRACRGRAGLGRDAAWLGTVFLALSLGLHGWPGFEALRAWPPVRLSFDSAVFAGTWSVDKWLAGLLILPMLVQGRPALGGVRTGVWGSAVMVLLVLGLAWALGMVRWDPKWSALFWLWSVGNLMTCLAEEAFFRGLVQGGLATQLAGRGGGSVTAWLGASAIFGIAHLGGGLSYAVLAGFAGLGYGWIYMRTGRIEWSIGAHFLLNMTHFLLFSYPRLAP